MCFHWSKQALAEVIRSCPEKTQIVWAERLGKRMLKSSVPNVYVQTLGSIGPKVRFAVDDLKSLIANEKDLHTQLWWSKILFKLEQDPLSVVGYCLLGLKDEKTKYLSLSLIGSWALGLLKPFLI